MLLHETSPCYRTLARTPTSVYHTADSLVSAHLFLDFHPVWTEASLFPVCDSASADLFSLAAPMSHMVQLCLGVPESCDSQHPGTPLPHAQLTKFQMRDGGNAGWEEGRSSWEAEPGMPWQDYAGSCPGDLGEGQLGRAEIEGSIRAELGGDYYNPTASQFLAV